MEVVEEVSLELSNGQRFLPVTIGRRGKKLSFRCRYDKGLVEEFRCMKGAEWVPEEKVWTATDCRRNWIQIESLQGVPCPECAGAKCAACGWSGLVYRVPKEFVRYLTPAPEFAPRRPQVKPHQRAMTRQGLHVRGAVWAAEQGVGKTLAIIELIEEASRRGFTDWWYVAPLKVTLAVELEFQKWGCLVKPKLVHYDVLHREVEAKFQCRSCGEHYPESRTWGKEPDLLRTTEDREVNHEPVARCPKCKEVALHENLWRRLPDAPAPHGVVFDESSHLKNGGSRRAEAAQHLADAIRAEHDGYVVEMTGTPAPKEPTDWHSQMEIAIPGWLRESSVVHLRRRLAIIEKGETAEGRAFPKVVGWKLDEVERLHARLKGPVEVHMAKDCLKLPPLTKSVLRCVISPDVLRAAKLVVQSSQNAVQALNRLRQLSDGFQYGGIHACSDCEGRGGLEVDSEEAAVECHACGGLGLVETTDAVRAPCPKDDLLRERLAANEAVGRIVVYGGYHASVDRIIDVCIENNWAVLRCDGRGWLIREGNTTYTKDVSATQAMDWLSEMDPVTRTDMQKLAFVAHPGSGGYGLNLAAARENVFFSNDFNGASRWQAEKRSHRQGQEFEVRITDLVNLPTDELVIRNLEKKRTLQSVTLGEVVEALDQ